MKKLEPKDQEFIESWIHYMAGNLSGYGKRFAELQENFIQVLLKNALAEIKGEGNPDSLATEENRILDTVGHTIDKMDFCYELIKKMQSQQFEAAVSAVEKAWKEKTLNPETDMPGIDLERLKELAEKYS